MTAEVEAVVDYQVEDGIATITLNRPDNRNAVNLDVCDAMYAALEEFESTDAARVAILTGSGMVFCAGADLKAVAAGDGPRIVGHRGGFGGFVRFHRTKPVIAAVNGHALAGGLELMLATELAVASTTALFGLPEVTVGLIAGAGGAVHLPRDLPSKVALRMLLTGAPIAADEALRHGLVSQVVEPDQVMVVAKSMAREIAAAAPLAVAATLKVARVAMDSGDEASAWRVNDDVMAEIFSSEDAHEGTVAFAEKRLPEWRSR